MTDPDVERIEGAIVAAWEAHAVRSAAESTGIHATSIGGGSTLGADDSATPLAKPSTRPGSLAPAGSARWSHPAPGSTSRRSIGPASPAGATLFGTSGAPTTVGRWVVLGAGTGVGKTYVARTLVELLSARGDAVAGVKPVETGVAADGWATTDASALQRSSFHVKHPEPHPLYSFRDPVTPALAARRERCSIDLQRVRGWLETARTADGSLPHLVVETAGGVFSPLADGVTNFELASVLGSATWVLVASDRLGVLHDVTATLLAMRANGRAPDCVVLSAPAEGDLSSTTNAAELRRVPNAPPIIELARGETLALAPLLALRGPA